MKQDVVIDSRSVALRICDQTHGNVRDPPFDRRVKANHLELSHSPASVNGLTAYEDMYDYILGPRNLRTHRGLLVYTGIPGIAGLLAQGNLIFSRFRAVCDRLLINATACAHYLFVTV